MVNETIKTIYYFLIIAWVIPAFRNHNTEYFIYFLILAIVDPVANLYRFLFDVQIPLYFYSLFFVLLFMSVVKWHQKKYVYFYLLLSLGFLGIFSIIENNIYVKLIPPFIFNLLVFFQFMRLFAKNVYLTGTFNFFFLVLIFYQLTCVMKILVVILRAENYYNFFLITGLAQILIAIFFSFFNVNSKSIQYYLKGFEPGSAND